jgi:hypothetical protein
MHVVRKQPTANYLGDYFMNFRTDRLRKFCLVAAGTLLTGIVLSQLGETSQATAQSGVRSSVIAQGCPNFEDRFWRWLQAAQYKNWAPEPGKSGDIYKGQSPHGAFLKVYMNRTAAGRPQELPHGSILVKENYGKDKKTLMAVTVMYRNKGYDKDHNDWYWVKYNPDGTVAKTPPEKGSKPIAGRFPSCIACHEGADGNDYTFAND